MSNGFRFRNISWRFPGPNWSGSRVGANRRASSIQLAHTEVGATTSVGPLGARETATASAWIVLPSPMSSAKQAPAPQAASRAAQRKPSAWYSRSGACSVEGTAGSNIRASRTRATRFAQCSSASTEPAASTSDSRAWILEGGKRTRLPWLRAKTARSSILFRNLSVRATNSPLAERQEPRPSFPDVVEKFLQGYQ